MPTGLGGEQMWISATNDNTGTSSAFNDQSGQGNNGTSVGATVVSDTSSGGTYAFEFDGISDAISTPFADTATTSTGVFSMACWVKYDAVFSNAALLSGNLSTAKTSLVMYFDTYSSSRGTGGLLNPNVSGIYDGQCYAADRDLVLTGQWYHVAYTGDGSTARLYVDGSEVDNAAQTRTSSSAWNNTLQMGRYITGTNTVGGHLDGRMDDARVYTRTIDQDEISHLATSRGIEGSPGGENYSPFRNAKYINKTYQIPRFG